MGKSIFCKTESPIPPSFHRQSPKADLKLTAGKGDREEGQRNPLLCGSHPYQSGNAEEGKGCCRLQATEKPSKSQCAEHSFSGCMCPDTGVWTQHQMLIFCSWYQLKLGDVQQS